MPGKEPRLLQESAAQLDQKVDLVHPIAPLMKRISRRGQVDSRADRSYTFYLRRRFLCPFSRELQHQISAHGKSDKRDPRDPLLLNEVLRHGSNILRPAGVIKSRSEVIHPPAIALVHADHIHSGRQALGSQAQGITGITRALESVDHNASKRVAAVGLPVAVAQNAYTGFYFHQPRFCGRKIQTAL